jgi:hypothetical protein
MKIIYRISDSGYAKVKPNYINNENCLKNALKEFPLIYNNWTVIADNVSEKTNEMIMKYFCPGHVIHVNIGHGAGTFNIALDIALKYKDNDIVYFLENDYLHRPGAAKVLLEGFKLGADYVTLYDHPDKFLPAYKGGNPLVEDGGEATKVLLSESTHWKFTNSTTMTFASTINNIARDESILRDYTKGQYPEDFKMFIALRYVESSLISPIPGYSTHGETQWLSPLIDWEEIAKNS